MEAWLPSIVSGAVAGLIAWGGIRVELAWLRRDVDRQQGEIDGLEDRIRAVELKRV